MFQQPLFKCNFFETMCFFVGLETHTSFKFVELDVVPSSINMSAASSSVSSTSTFGLLELFIAASSSVADDQSDEHSEEKPHLDNNTQ